jgi:hypothetical protein
LDKGYNSVKEEQELIKQGYLLHIPIKKKKKKKKMMMSKEEAKIIPFVRNTLQRDGL